MPYIKTQDRPRLDEIINMIPEDLTDGELNYFITRILAKKCKNYSSMNSMVGVLECVKLELYRRKISLYENEKISQNGDVQEYSI